MLLRRFADATGIDVSTWKIDSAASNATLDAVQIELVRRLNQVAALSLDVRAQRRLVNVALLPRIRTANDARRLRLPADHRDWVEEESSRRLGVLRASGAVIHGDLQELEPPADSWESTATYVSDADLLHEALLLLTASNPDSEPESLEFL